MKTPHKYQEFFTTMKKTVAGNHNLSKQLAILVSVWFVLTAIFSVTLFSHRIDVSVGDLAPRNVFAPYGVVDWGATLKARKQAAQSVANVYTPNQKILSQQRQKVVNDFSLITSLAVDTQVPLATREKMAEKNVPIGVPVSVWQQILTRTPSQLSQLQQNAIVVLSSVMGNGNGVRDTTVGKEEAKGFVTQLANQEESNPSLRQFLTGFTQHFVVPNTFLNRQVMATRRQQAMNRVPLVKILKGEQVLHQGQTVTTQDVKLLQQLGLLAKGFDIGPVMGSGVFSAVLVGLVVGYLVTLRKDLLESRPVALITGLMVVGPLLIVNTLSTVPAISYMVVPTVAVLVTALVDSGLGMVIAGVVSLAVAFLTSAGLNVALVAFFGSIAGVYGMSRLSQRFDIVRTGLLIGVVNLLSLAGLDIMEGVSLIQTPVWQDLIMALAFGLFASVFAMGLIPLLEAPFGIVTSMKLIELSNPNQPLLRKLLVEAPGTYHHSIMVGNLAEAATEAVGGNSLLARVGAYYHDIGKTKRPYFFIDNQFGAENPHDRLSPSLSSLIISSHVRDGIELTRQYHLPETITNFVREHHGTTLISYFYRKALESDQGDGVLEEDFRYDGPRPQSKETAIVMLADASEAVSRTLKSPTPPAIEQVVRKIIKDRLQDGQLDESNLTLKELDTIAKTFTRILTGVFHQRVEYPEKVLKEMERSRTRGNMDRKSGRGIRRMGGDS